MNCYACNTQIRGSQVYGGVGDHFCFACWFSLCDLEKRLRVAQWQLHEANKNLTRIRGYIETGVVEEGSQRHVNVLDDRDKWQAEIMLITGQIEPMCRFASGSPA